MGYKGREKKERKSYSSEERERDSCYLLRELHPKACCCADGEEAGPCVVVLCCVFTPVCLVMHLFSVFFSFFTL